MKYQSDALGAAMLLVGALSSMSAQGACYRVSRSSPTTDINAVDYVEPGRARSGFGTVRRILPARGAGDDHQYQ